MPSQRNEQLEALQTVLNALTAFKNRPACISAAKHRYGMLLDGIEKYRRTKNSADYIKLEDNFLFEPNPTAMRNFEEKVKDLITLLEDKIN